MSRFDYVKYDDVAAAKQAKLKAAAQKVEDFMKGLDKAQDEMRELIEDELIGQPSASCAQDKLTDACLADDCYERLEESYMWCGKAIRDDQIKRNGSAPLQEERTES